jgi:hypothetical protein
LFGCHPRGPKSQGQGDGAEHANAAAHEPVSEPLAMRTELIQESMERLKCWRIKLTRLVTSGDVY